MYRSTAKVYQVHYNEMLQAHAAVLKKHAQFIQLATIIYQTIDVSFLTWATVIVNFQTVKQLRLFGAFKRIIKLL